MVDHAFANALAGRIGSADRRSVLAGVGAVAVAFGLAACSGGGNSGRTKLVLGDQLHLIQSQLEAAGALKDVPYDYEWASFSGAAPLLEALSAGAVDTAPAGDLPVVLAAAAGSPLKIVAASVGSPRDIAIIVPARSAIKSVAELKGRQVIVSSARGSISHYLLLEALKEAKVDRKDVTIGFMLPNDAAAAFASNKIDAWAIFGTYQLAAETTGARVLRDGTGINSNLLLIAANEASLTDPAKRAAIKDVIARQTRAKDWVIANPVAYAKIFADVTKLDPKLSLALVQRQNGPMVAPTPAALAPLQRVADRFYADGEMPAHVDLAKIVDTGIFTA
ncbi:ABC nitrate/sulfonate/bicarbonate family transporter, periplasmic ligand binding protein [Novosphingobium sp. Rr 2-17]|uniref:ABC transporter substrate-binding protein n=1 Tax=Novosphingobium sp. Rr 2-17 TaxID=555793 RepID=UPI0002698F0F|nr:ABC transporter substrate-binding protein [Novosphingobium sp. Rr 2-17]EIZ78165.1 ABC nitrate/sulfonate/bicarbonate family transporter, periplasmic ligand binding protein [Novosphingobium sp. Rr 2-17]